MSAHSFPKIDQKEYLKKYLSGDKVKKKKKDRKHKKPSIASVKVKIIDDDINNMDNGPEIDEELLLGGEDAPQIVGEYIEEQPADRKVPKWKSIVVKDEPEDENETDLWGMKSEFTTEKKRSNKTLDNSPPRRNERKYKTSSSHQKLSSPPRGSQKSLKSFESEIKYEENSSSNIKTKPHSLIYQKRERRESSDESPPRRRNSDQSPPRKVENLYRNNRKRSSSDLSPPRKTESSLNRAKKRSDSDQSPPRRYKNRDQSPTIRKQHAYESSFKKSKSPTRNYRRKSSLTSPNRPRRDSDQSPPRRNKILDKSRNSDLFSSDESPPRRSRNSPIRKRKELADRSPPRRRKRSPYSASPSRIKREKGTPERSRWVKLETEKSLSPPPTHKPKSDRTLEGKKVGLQDAKSLQKETAERRKKEDLQFEKMSSEVSGRNAEVRVRATGRKGRRAREAADEDPEERRRKEAHEEKKKLLYERWGKGLKQIEDHEQRMLEQKYESSKPLARYSNDEDLERHLKEQERAEDPMLEYMRQKRKEKETISGKPQIPRYEGPYPENRFGIRPGYRWDGVDRSNGYEKKYFAVQSERQARQDEAYKFSVEDM